MTSTETKSITYTEAAKKSIMQWRKANPDAYREYQREYHKARRLRIKQAKLEAQLKNTNLGPLAD